MEYMGNQGKDCQEPGCDRPAQRRGLRVRHYFRRWRRKRKNEAFTNGWLVAGVPPSQIEEIRQRAREIVTEIGKGIGVALEYSETALGDVIEEQLTPDQVVAAARKAAVRKAVAAEEEKTEVVKMLQDL